MPVISIFLQGNKFTLPSTAPQHAWNLLPLKDQSAFFWQHSNFGQLTMNGVFFSLKFSHNIFPGSSFKAQQFSWLLATSFKSYYMICSFQHLAGSLGNKNTSLKIILKINKNLELIFRFISTWKAFNHSIWINESKVMRNFSLR